MYHRPRGNATPIHHKKTGKRILAGIRFGLRLKLYENIDSNIHKGSNHHHHGSQHPQTVNVD
ncbi:hypothetical protein JOE21_002390 [Desmospora profundinema]|uniref:Uncharacterized protein n=1 Tax=Desmospora profundinema TaxID=1571184 RepID=A0ABU1IPQ3_9BACL|nr:hypothetical protein [Desmospora profundinema]